MTGSFTSGLGAQLGLAAETTYGTAVTVNRFFEFKDEQLNLSRAFLMSQGLRAGRLYQSATRRTATTRSAAGTVGLEVPSAGFGPILNLLHGETVAPVKNGAGTSYTQTHKIGTTDPYKKSATLQVGRPTTEGVVKPFTFPGSVLLSAAFTCQTGGFLEATLTVDAQDESTGIALATASYPTGLESFNFTQCTVKIAGVEQTQNVRGVTITVGTPKDVARYYLGAEKKAQPLTNAFNSATLSLNVDFKDQTLYNFFSKGETASAEVIFEGPIASETFHKKLAFEFPVVGFDGDSPNVAGPPVLQQTIPLVTLDNGTEAPLTATYVSLDSAL